MAEKLEREVAVKLITDLHKRFGEGGADPVHLVDRTRTEHYFNETSQNPPMLKGYEGHSRQWTGLRDKNTELSARLTANPILPDVSAPRPSSNLEKQASDNELALLTMMEEIAQEDGASPQVLIADGIGRLSAVGLHWYLNDGYDGEELDYEEIDELPEDEREAKRYTEDEYRPVGKKQRQKKLRYRESEDSLMERRYAQKAMQGSPWCVEVLESTEFAYVENPKSLRKQHGPYKYLLKVSAVDLIDWVAGQKVDVHGAKLPADVLPGGQLDTSQPTYSHDSKSLVLFCLWSKDWIYEWVKDIPAGSGVPDFRVIKNRHHYVTLALIAAKVNLSRDHVRRYEPALTSWMRKKPEYDRYIANRGVLAETGAIPRWIIQQSDKSLPPLTDDDGHTVMLSQHAMQTWTLEPGQTFVKVGGDGAGADYVKYGEELRLELVESMPQTGTAEIDSSTKPWTGRMMLSQANEFPAMCLDHMVAGYRAMFQNMADVNASEDGPGEICFYPKEGEKDSVIVIQPEEWKGMRYDAKVNKTSAQEQISKTEHMRELLNDPLVMLPLETFIEEGEGRPNPQDEVAKRMAIAETRPVIQNLVKARVSEWAGAKFLLTPELQIGDMTNRQVTPGEALTSIGQQPTPQPVSPVGGNGLVTPQQAMAPLSPQPAQNGMAAVDGMR